MKEERTRTRNDETAVDCRRGEEEEEEEEEEREEGGKGKVEVKANDVAAT